MTKSSSPSKSTSSDGSLRLAAEAIRQAVIFGKHAKAILATHESAKSRIITVEESYKQLKKLSIKQDDLFRQALRCIEHSLFRAAHVLAWAGIMDFFEEKIAKDHLKSLVQLKPHRKLKTIEDLRDVGSDYQIVEAMRELGLCTKIEEKAVRGLLNRRNECAHPTDYYPGLNETLGYISEVLQRLQKFQQRWS